MTNNTPIFTITTATGALRGGTRAVGFFHALKDAIDNLVNNSFDINECGYYRYGIIEEVHPGFYTYPREELWFKWNPDSEKFEPCPKPERFKQVVGWSLG